MRAAYYEKNGPARDVLRLGEVETPQPGPGEVRVKLAVSGVNPSDVKWREGRTRKIAFPRVIPHSDGAGLIDMVGDGVAAARVGERVWTWNAQWKRAFGTCAEYVVLPAALAVPPARPCELRGRRLFRHSGDDRLPRGGGRRSVGRFDHPGVRRRRHGRPLRHPVCQGARRRRHHHGELGGKGQARRGRRRRPRDRLQARECRRARHGAHRQGRRRRRDRARSQRQCQAHPRRAAPARHGRHLRHRREASFRRNGSW